MQQEIPPPFSGRFLEVISIAMMRGHISARRVSELLDMDLDELVELFDAHAIECPFEF